MKRSSGEEEKQQRRREVQMKRSIDEEKFVISSIRNAIIDKEKNIVGTQVFTQRNDESKPRYGTKYKKKI